MIQAQNLTKRFDDVTAVDNIDCTIPEGCIYGLVGSNGAGKSTFIRLAAGVYRPDGGAVLYDGDPVYENPAVKRRLAYVSDELYFLPGANVERMALLYEAIHPRFSRERCRRLTELFGLPEKRPISTFSKGMRRQAATLLALCSGADILFFDETFDGLDAVMRRLIRGLIYEEVADRRATAIIASHSLRELEGTCDQLALLHKGGLVLESDVDGLQTTSFKIQVAYPFAYEQSLFDEMGIRIVQFSKLGSVANLIVRGDRAAITARMEEKSPNLLEILPLSLEELFIFEMSARGYTFDPADAPPEGGTPS